MNNEDHGPAMGWLIQFHASGPRARFVSRLVLAVASVSIVLGAVATAHSMRPAGVGERAVVVAGLLHRG